MTNEEFESWQPDNSVIEPYARANWAQRGSPLNSTEEQKLTDWMLGKVTAWINLVYIPLLRNRSGQQDRRVK